MGGIHYAQCRFCVRVIDCVQQDWKGTIIISAKRNTEKCIMHSADSAVQVDVSCPAFRGAEPSPDWDPLG